MKSFIRREREIMNNKFLKHLSKNKLTYFVGIIAYILLIYLLLNSDNSIDQTFIGTKYQLGHEEYIEKMEITFKGRYSNPIIGRKRFKGVVILDGEELLIDLKFDKYNSTVLHALKKSGHIISIGHLYIEPDFNEFTICLFEKENGVSSWNSESGFMFSTTASNRVAALNLSNKLMGNQIEDNHSNKLK